MIELPIRTVNGLNAREHWAVRMRRAKEERNIAYITCPKVPVPASVRLTRVGKKLMDSDGLAASFKHIRDGIADRLGVDDGSDLINFEYAQRKDVYYGIEIEFLSTGD